MALPSDEIDTDSNTHGFRVLDLADVLDPTRYTSYIADTNLEWAGQKDAFIEMMGEWKDSFQQIQTEKETAAYLNRGKFEEVFEELRDGKDFPELAFFAALSMKVGAKIPQKHRRYLKQLYIPEDMVNKAAQLQFRQAVKEHVDGKPYRPLETGNTLWAQYSSVCRTHTVD